MNLKHLEYFRVLAKFEHYTLAAEQLSIAQPSLTYAISELEKELGVYLFEKSGRNIRLTKYGSIFLQYVNKSLNSLDEGQRIINDLVSPNKGTIDLSFIYTLGSRFVPTMVKNFLSIEKHKDISFSFSQGTTQNIIEGLKSDKYDLAFCSYIEDEPNIDFIPLVKQNLVLVVPSGHPLASYTSIDLKDTEPFPFVYFDKGSGLRRLSDRLFKEVDITPNIAFEVEEDSAAIGLVSMNYGIALLPDIWMLKHFDVRVLPIRNPPYERFIYLATVKNKYLSPVVHLFRDFAKHYNKNYSSQIEI
ncbi:LysR family transcriptional regulator [Bacillus sp. AFS076308]|uniref:LysR family transcriptional regulator n=1 Tax=unclassified Bacillus (in: firmicutes) TaxID=185979 RepID=UPI000BF7321C|nr:MULTISPECIES: LysR family transcriptional regulator [unclassified Bacillus (in: firmicutes)]PFO09387.1 LysR family transcriptional regulator [Bacillus sp. AFS076308]PGV50365.1 LysR family transcriptional regulator [Bacillus sp. AFS037270]